MCNSFNKRFLDEASKHWSSSEERQEQKNESFMNEAIDLSLRGVEANYGGPFGCIIVKNGKIIGRGNNRVTSNHDPTAHAEVLAIREACSNLGNHELQGCVMYSTCEPCPMCLSAIYWARLESVFFAATRADAADSGFDDAFIYEQIGLKPEERTIKFYQLKRNDALKAFLKWDEKEDKIEY
jgi:tRNA(Arg) A34 adenosine deaminase TadA